MSQSTRLRPPLALRTVYSNRLEYMYVTRLYFDWLISLNVPRLRLTVAMMSRITLHLRRQARSQERDSLPTFSRVTFNTMEAIRSRLRFGSARSTACQSPDPRAMVHVEDRMAKHDDVRSSVHSYPPSLLTKTKNDDTEWYEIRPPAPVRISSASTGRFKLGKFSEFRFNL